MKYSAKKHTYGNIVCETYNQIMEYFSRQFLNSENVEDGRNFLYDFGEYIEDSDFPCDKIVLNCFTGYSDIFGISLKYKDENIAYIQLRIKKNGIIEVYNKSYDKKDFMMFHHIIEHYFEVQNEIILDFWKRRCNITDSNEIIIENYVDYQVKDTSVLKGTLEEIFEKYTSINDMYKYCNGHYVRFKDNNISNLYYIFIDCYKGNYFLDNAVKRGVIID